MGLPVQCDYRIIAGTWCAEKPQCQTGFFPAIEFPGLRRILRCREIVPDMPQSILAIESIEADGQKKQSLAGIRREQGPLTGRGKTHSASRFVPGHDFTGWGKTHSVSRFVPG